MTDMTRSRLVELVGTSALADKVADGLRDQDWHVRDAGSATATTDVTGDLHGLLFEPGLLTEPESHDEGVNSDVAVEARLRAAVDRARPRFPVTGGRVVVLVSRDYLGAPSRTRIAAAGGALVSAVRSLALELGRSGMTVNAVVGLAVVDATEHDETVGSYVESLLPWDVEPADLAAAVSFLLDERSAYITGQVLHCTGGASLLSSLTA